MSRCVGTEHPDIEALGPVCGVECGCPAVPCMAACPLDRVYTPGGSAEAKCFRVPLDVLGDGTEYGRVTISGERWPEAGVDRDLGRCFAVFRGRCSPPGT